jgi:hypothetical protein
MFKAVLVVGLLMSFYGGRDIVFVPFHQGMHITLFTFQELKDEKM